LHSFSRGFHDGSPHPFQTVATFLDKLSHKPPDQEILTAPPKNISGVIVDHIITNISHLLPTASKTLQLAEQIKAHPMSCTDPTTSSTLRNV
jgi:hypothetical protein